MFMQNQSAFDRSFSTQQTGDLTQADMIDIEAAMFPAILSRTGMIEGTNVEAADGWRPVESLSRGDAVFTLDGGLRQIQTIHRQSVQPARTLLVPGGALDNCADMMLLPGQHVLLEDDRAEAAFGSPMALVPAASLAGFRTIKWVNWSAKASEIITLEFEEEEVVYSNTGALLHCPSARQFGAARLVSKFFTILDMQQARAMIALLNTQERAYQSSLAA